MPGQGAAWGNIPARPEVRFLLPATTLQTGGEPIVANGKYQRWLEPEGLALLEGWARDGLTDEQIARNMGCSLSSLKTWKKEHLAILTALKRGKEVVDYEVENALLRSALDGNTTAQIFWLKNRRPDKWRDKPQEGGTAAQEDGHKALIEAITKRTGIKT